MKNIPEGFEVCEDCNGKGHVICSCCAGEPVTGYWEDVEMCPICKEHLGEEDCQTCEGKGIIEILN